MLRFVGRSKRWPATKGSPTMAERQLPQDRCTPEALGDAASARGLDDYVSEHNAVRAILMRNRRHAGRLQALGFETMLRECELRRRSAGVRSPLLLKLYLYGYQHRVRSSPPARSRDAAQSGSDLSVPECVPERTRRLPIFARTMRLARCRQWRNRRSGRAC